MNTPLHRLGSLQGVVALERPDLLAPSVAAALTTWEHADQVAVVEIDPDHADTATLVEVAGIPADSGANCVVISGRRDGAERVAAVLVPTHKRADVNNAIKRALDVRKCSFHPHERAVTESGMEYGGITPLGIPHDWRLLVDVGVGDIDVCVIGSGVRRSKLLVPGHLLLALPGAEVAQITL